LNDLATIGVGKLARSEELAADDLLRGALLARWVAAGLELKCRRCKRTTLIPYPKRTAVTRRQPT